MQNDIEKRKGEMFVVAGSLLWAAFPVVVVMSYAKISGLVSLAWSTVFAAVFLVGVILWRGSWQDMKSRLFWQYTAAVAFFNGVLFYSLFYIGLEHTTPGNASLIALIEILTSFIFFNLFKKEHISREHKVGSVLMFLGALIVLSNNFSHFNIGDLLIFVAMFCGPIGNHFQQKVRRISATENLLLGRYLITIPVVFLMASILHPGISLGFSRSSFWLLAFNGLLIFGLSKIFWVEGIHRIPVTKAISLSSASPIITMFLAWVLLKQSPTMWQLTAFIPLFLGIILLTDNYKFKDFPVN